MDHKKLVFGHFSRNVKISAKPEITLNCASQIFGIFQKKKKKNKYLEPV